MIKIKKKIFKSIGFLLILFMVAPLFSGCAEKASNKYSVDLEIWGVFDDNNDFSDIIGEYRKINPLVNKITYRKFSVDEYEKALIDALASGNGPDIFMVNNAWMPRYENKVAPAPDILINEQSFRNNFVDVAANDFIGKNGEIYGVPLSVDSLALYYNKDLLNAAGITSPPKTWSELLADSRKITKIDDLGNIVRSGVAMGTAYNINRSTDIIDLLMLQQGAQLPTRNKPIFNPDFTIGQGVLNFYTQFARLSSPAYTWNNRMHYSLDAFYEGKVAMMLNYSWHYNTIKNKNAKLNFAVAPIPQSNSSKPVDYANYWAFAVNKNKIISQKSRNAVPITSKVRIGEAWEFLRFMTFKNSGRFVITNFKSGKTKEVPTDMDPASVYLEKTKKPAARRDLIDKQRTDPILGPFAYGNLIAKTWYKKDSEAIEGIFAEVINDINKGDLTAEQGFRTLVSRVGQINK